MIYKENISGNTKYITDSRFEEGGKVISSFTTKIGGVSRGNIQGFNLGFNVDDHPDSVRENYRILCNELGIEFEKCVLSSQTHSDNIRVVTADDCGKGLARESNISCTDALITEEKGIPLVIFFADCVPLMFWDKVKNIIGVTHAGWKGTAIEITRKTVEKMVAEYSCNPMDIIVSIGPSIGPCCFECDIDTAGEFKPEFVKDTGKGKYIVDLWLANKTQLTESGIPEENIEILRECTVCNEDKYYSFRREKEHAGRMAAVIMLKA